MPRNQFDSEAFSILIRYQWLSNSSLYTLKNTNSYRYSFTINFGKFVNKKTGYKEKQNFYGISKIALNSMFYDPTLMKEYLAYELMDKMNIPSS